MIKFLWRRWRLAREADALRDRVAVLEAQLTTIRKDLEQLPTKRTTPRKLPAWGGLVGMLFVAALLFVACRMALTPSPDHAWFIDHVDVVGAAFVGASVFLQTVMIMWDQWKLPYSGALMGSVVVATIAFGIIGASLVFLGLLPPVQVPGSGGGSAGHPSRIM